MDEWNDSFWGVERRAVVKERGGFEWLAARRASSGDTAVYSFLDRQAVRKMRNLLSPQTAVRDAGVIKRDVVNVNLCKIVCHAHQWLGSVLILFCGQLACPKIKFALTPSKPSWHSTQSNHLLNLPLTRLNRFLPNSVKQMLTLTPIKNPLKTTKNNIVIRM
jgi:hypothetical protein